MPTPKPVTMTNAEAEALYKAACYVITLYWGSTDESRALTRATSKLRRASTLIIEQKE